MSRRSLHSSSTANKAVLDYYKLLRVSRHASLADIKQSYRQLAMEYHPDRHDGCSEKEAQFKQINHAYQVLMDSNQRRQYDKEEYHHHHRNKKTNSSSSWQYRKVYAPSPPPEWKGGVWNHRHHYDMHYGDGFSKQAFEQMRQTAKKEGAFQYQSPLGRGFTFDTTTDTTDTNTTTAEGSSSRQQHNPYSKAPQGPPTMTMEYEEIERDMVSGKEHVLKRERVVEDLYQRRQERYQSTNTRRKQQHTTQNAAFARRRQQQECVIL